MTKQHRVAVIVIVALILASFVQGLIMCGEVGLTNGWLLIRNDPGKFIFHLLLLPVASGALVWSFPTRLAQAVFAKRGFASYALMAACGTSAALAIFIGIQETIEGFEKRIPVPTDVRAAITTERGTQSARDVLLAAWNKFHDSTWVPGSASTSTTPYARERAAEYGKTLESVLGSKRNFWEQASVGAWWSGFLSILGIMFVVGWLLTIVVVAIRHRLLDPQTTNELVVAFCIGLASAGLWFYFKIYSEWYINFYSVSAASLPPLVMTLLATLVLAAMAALVKDAQHPLTWFGRLAAMGGLATGLAAYWKPELLRSVADAYRQANNSSVVGLWAVTAVSAFVAAYLTASNTLVPSTAPRRGSTEGQPSAPGAGAP